MISRRFILNTDISMWANKLGNSRDKDHYNASTQTKPLIEKIIQWIINKEQGMVISFVNEPMILKNTNTSTKFEPN